MNIIGLVGGKGVGKDTFYHTLKALGYPVERIAFADFIKADCSNLQGLEGAPKEVARPVWQAYGQAVKEIHGQNYWIRRLERYLTCTRDTEYLVLTDVRFPFEADWVRGNGGYLIKLTRPIATLTNTDQHVSEQSWQSIRTDANICNDSTRPDYVKKILHHWGPITNHFI